MHTLYAERVMGPDELLRGANTGIMANGVIALRDIPEPAVVPERVPGRRRLRQTTIQEAFDRAARRRIN